MILINTPPWKDKDKIRQAITEEIPAKVLADKAYQNAMKNNDKKQQELSMMLHCSASWWQY